MGNLIGSNPRKFVKTQVDLRQQLLGLEIREPEVLTWSNNNTAWIRAVSSVNISTPEKSEALTGSKNFQGDLLAKNFILYNGVSRLDNEGKLIQPSGLYDGNPDNIFKNVYGFAGDNQQVGLVPPPGIESLDIKTYNRGSFRKATLKLKANSKKQFDIIEALYMHPGFTVLVEWGHTLYYTHNDIDVSSKKYEQATFNTPAFSNFFKDDVNQNNILALINSHTATTCGNYDGFFGKIVNFKWSFEEDNSYSITVDIISIGDVIESLTINRSTAIGSSPFGTEPPPESTPGTPERQPETEAARTTRENKEQANFLTRAKRIGDKLSRNAGNFLATVSSGANITGTKDNNGGTADRTAYSNFVQSLSSADVKALASAGLVAGESGFDNAPKTTYTVETEAEEALSTSLIANKDKSQLHKYLYEVYDKLKKNESKGAKVNTYNCIDPQYNPKKLPQIQVYGDSTYKNEDETPFDPKEQLVIKPQRRARRTKSGSNGSSYASTVTVESKNSPYQYVKLYHILRYIEENLLIYSKDKEGNKTPLIKFDQNYKETYCFTYPTQFSTDPSVCIIPFRVSDYNKDEEKGDPQLGYLVENQMFECFKDVLENKSEDTNFRIPGQPYTARLMFIHVNLHFVVDCLEASTNENGVILLRFLEQLLSGIQEALGNVNKLNVTYDHDINTIKFMDDIPLDPNFLKLVDPTNFDDRYKTLFNVYGWRPGRSKKFDSTSYLDVTGNSLPGYGNVQNGSFVYSVNLDSGLTPQFATMLAIGAQSRGTSDITNATAFNKFHEGLKDRIIPDKLSKAVAENLPQGGETMSEAELKELKFLRSSATANDQKRYAELLDKYKRIYGNFTDALEIFKDNIKILRAKEGLIEKFYQRGLVVDSEILDINRNISGNVSKYVVSLLNDEGDAPPASGFIPFDLNLTMLGLSGVRMYERFYIDQNILPSSYNRNLSFIIKGVDHKVSSKGWETTITSLAAVNNATTQNNSNLSLPKNEIEPSTNPSEDE